VEPIENPYAALLAIDFPAMKAREYQYLVDLRDSPDWIDETGYLLNIHYTAALAQYSLEKDQKTSHEGSTASLGAAIRRFPWLIAPLFFALKLSFPADFPPTAPRSALQALYVDLYLHRSKDLWSIPEISTWLVRTATTVGPQISDGEPTSDARIPLNVARHLYVMNVPGLMSHIPREYLSGAQMAIDPLPPLDSVSPYALRLRSLEREMAQERAVQNLLNFRGAEEIRREDRGEEEAGEGEEGVGEEGVGEEGEGDEEGLLGHILTNFRNAFAWFQGGGEPDDEEEEEEEETGLMM
jgi:Transcriptional repressor TCF25